MKQTGSSSASAALAATDSDHLEALKIARDAIVAGIANGRLTVDYMIRGRRHTVEASTEALNRLEQQIERYERKASAASRSPFRLARLSGARGSDC